MGSVDDLFLSANLFAPFLCSSIYGGLIRWGMPHFKRKRAVQTGECLNSPKGLKRHSPSDQPTINATAEKGANILADRNKSSTDPWARLIGRANEEQIFINGHPVTALLDTGS